jgi:hypothetical protein
VIQKDLFGDPIDEDLDQMRTLGPRQDRVIRRVNSRKKIFVTVDDMREDEVPFAEILEKYHGCFAVMQDFKGILLPSIRVDYGQVNVGTVRKWVKLWYPANGSDLKVSKLLRPSFHPKSPRRRSAGELTSRVLAATFLHRKKWFRGFDFFLTLNKRGISHLDLLIQGQYDDGDEPETTVTGRWD